MSTYTEVKKRYYEKNKEKWKQYHKDWLAKNKVTNNHYMKDYMKEYRTRDVPVPDDGWKFVGKSNSGIKGI